MRYAPFISDSEKSPVSHEGSILLLPLNPQRRESESPQFPEQREIIFSRVRNLKFKRLQPLKNEAAYASLSPELCQRLFRKLNLAELSVSRRIG